jgi:phenylpropionate dioxygenase-like ring-hydroxylating dioxygenase large terminal subunit
MHSFTGTPDGRLLQLRRGPPPSARLPYPSAPSGWFLVCPAHELPMGATKAFVCDGRELVAFRGWDNTVRVLDAHCPHLGTHLGRGGRVVGDRLECPFHGWQLNGQGQCAHIPYASKIPPGAQVRSWPVREANGLVMMYYDREGRPPAWDLPVLDEYGAPDWTPFKLGPRAVLRTHPQELMENGVDTAHLGFLHRRQVREVRTDALEVKGPLLIHRALQSYTHPLLRALGISLPPGPLTLHFHGLGLLVVWVSFRYVVEVDLMTVLAFRPIDAEQTDVVTLQALRAPGGRRLGGLLLDWTIRQTGAALAEDIAILEHKRYLPAPKLCRGDDLIMRFRRWAGQFYAETEVGENDRSTSAATAAATAPERQQQARGEQQAAGATARAAHAATA